MVLADGSCRPAVRLVWVVLQRAGLAVHSVERVFLEASSGIQKKSLTTQLSRNIIPTPSIGLRRTAMSDASITSITPIDSIAAAREENATPARGPRAVEQPRAKPERLDNPSSETIALT